MDDYVSKPLHPDELVKAVERVAEPGRAGEVAETSAAAASSVVFDKEQARLRLGGDRRLLRELIAIFRADSPALMAQISDADAVTSEDLEALLRAAHALKGALGTLGAPRAYDVAATLETCARERETSRIPAALAALQREMSELGRALAPVRRQRTAAR
jgi:HPt (histidine-containing phosphotransfer) domain-containing protein